MLTETDDGQMVRLDFSQQHWEGPDKNCIGFWKQQVPDLKTGKVYWAPRSVLLAYFKHQLENERFETAYVMSLLLIQKKFLSVKDRPHDEQNISLLVDRRSAESFEVPEIAISDDAIASIENELAQHLFSNQPMVDEEESS